MNGIYFFTGGILCSLLCLLLFFLALGGTLFRWGVTFRDVIYFFSRIKYPETHAASAEELQVISEKETDETVSSSEGEERVSYEKLMELYQDTMHSYEHQTKLFQQEREENKRLTEEHERYMREIESLKSVLENKENSYSETQLSSILRRIFNLTDRLDEITEKLYSVESSEIADGSRFNTPDADTDGMTAYEETSDRWQEVTASDSPAGDPSDENPADSEITETVPAAESGAQPIDATSVTAYEIRKLDRLLNKPVLSHYDNRQATEILSAIGESELLQSMIHCRNTSGVPMYEKIENMKRDFESVLNSRNTSPEMKDEASVSIAMIGGLVYSGIPGRV